jgi:hypothetical protein
LAGLSRRTCLSIAGLAALHDRSFATRRELTTKANIPAMKSTLATALMACAALCILLMEELPLAGPSTPAELVE